ncbi:hypothetical protein [Pontiella desulfatans]|uniref:hypothetical protein n=1 Tax=Pontiella desulfatans TaxID=2750659 RepID=UPI00109CB255|nr:hypothetical protein [Pontiella desulfatans]
MKSGMQRDEPLDIHPYRDQAPPPKLNIEINGLLDQLGECAKKHPFWFSAGMVAAGVGGIMLGPGLVTLGQGVMVIGGILVAAGMLSVVYIEKAEAEKLISAGLLTLVAGAGIVLVGFALTTAGIVAVVGGTGVATKATVEEVLRRKIEKQMREKSISELIGISRQLKN